MAEALERVLLRLNFNPAVAWHELRMRMRAGRAFRLLGTYALLAGLAVGLTVWFSASQAVGYGGSPPTDLGRTGLHALTYMQLTLIFITLPAFAASTIAGERERGTLEMLRATLLTPWDVVTGKLLSVLAFATILLGATVPVASWCLMLGGVSPTEVFRIYMLLLATAWWVTSLGVLMSTHFARPLGAIVATYGTILGAGALTVLIALRELSGFRGASPGLGPALATLVVALLAVVIAVVAGGLVRWLLSGIPPLRGRMASTVVRTASVAVLFGLIIVAATPLIEQLTTRVATSVLLLTPYVGAAATLEESVARDLLRVVGRSATATTGEPLAGHVWLALMWTYVAAALGLWMLAMYNYARKTR